MSYVPVLALGALATLLAAAAALRGPHSDLMSLAAACLGAAAIALAAILFNRLARRGRASDRALHAVEAQAGSIAETAMDAIITVDESQNVVLFNAAAETVFGWPRGRILGRPLDMLIPERLHHEHRKHVDRFGAIGVTSRRMGAATVLTGLRADGAEFPIEASISRVNGAQGKLFTVILRDVTERIRADAALRRSQEELRELASAASNAREQERSRVARELHDDLAQSLTALKMDLTRCSADLRDGETQLRPRLEAMQAMVDETVKATRRISADLRPLMLDDLGLVPAAEWLIQNFTQRTGIPCEFSVDPPELDLQDPHATAVFRILQESLTNAAKHAQAARVDVSVSADEAEIILRVRDDGRGFDTGQPRKPNSFGLAGLRERASLLGGDISVESAAGRGTLVEVRIPLAQAAPAA